ncbi:hypothetical protein [Alteraurantiacibacter palmitatis]|uniref:Uncharacterized protein n=1 Tax=Alteraurantiacibacter palmitatis TaxID=2054628 RepID=A0ABV7E3V0_9SPHN
MPLVVLVPPEVDEEVLVDVEVEVEVDEEDEVDEEVEVLPVHFVLQVLPEVLHQKVAEAGTDQVATEARARAMAVFLIMNFPLRIETSGYQN